MVLVLFLTLLQLPEVVAVAVAILRRETLVVLAEAAQQKLEG
jgi:hypothetical protein